MNTKIKEIVGLAVASKASDIHLAVGMVPRIRVNGELIELKQMETEETMMREMILSLVSDEGRKTKLMEEKELDFSFVAEQCRFRVNVYFKDGKIAAAMRLIPVEIPQLANLNLPRVLGSFLNYNQGLVLVTGPTGQGKSTTVAAMINEINKNYPKHIVTIEDPIEYLIKPVKSMISQREVGEDTQTFARALRSCLRQDPNVVFVGEMRDLETIGACLTVAETGHLVFSTLHTNSAAQTIDRIIDVFPEAAKAQVKQQLAAVVTAVVSQRLLPCLDGGRIPAVEIMVATPAIKNMIREGKTFMIDNVIQTSGDLGMESLETSLAGLVKKGLIREEVALAHCLRPLELQNRLIKSR